MNILYINICEVTPENVDSDTHHIFPHATLLEGSTSFSYAPGDHINWSTQDLEVLGYKDFTHGINDTYILCKNKNDILCICELVACELLFKGASAKLTEGDTCKDTACERINVQKFIKE